MNRRLNLIGLLFGSAFGFVLAAADLNSYDTIHEALSLESAYVYLLMGSAIAVALPLLWILERRKVRTVYGGPLALSRSKPQRHHVIGGTLFGTGWAVAGTCPAPALAMVASGALLGVVTIAGLFGGLQLRDWHVKQLPADGDGEHNHAPSLTIATTGATGVTG